MMQVLTKVRAYMSSSLIEEGERAYMYVFIDQARMKTAARTAKRNDTWRIKDD